MTDRDHGPGDPDFVRPLGAAEHGLDVMETARGTCHIVRVMTFDGKLDTELFERALRNLVRRRPILNTRIVRVQEQVPYFAHSERWPEVTFVERRDLDDWRAEFERQLSTPVSVAGDALLRATALIDDNGGQVVLSCHHAVCDGRSLTAFCRDLVHEYEWMLRGAPGDPAAVTGAVSPPMDELLPPSLTGPDGGALLEQFSARLRTLMTSPPGLLVEFPPQGDAPPGRNLLTYELPPAETHSLATMARANGTTVGGAISAAILRAGLDIGGSQAEDVVGLASNIDLRPHLREDVPVSNMGTYASSFFNAYDGVRTKPFWTLARQITEDVRASIESLEAFCVMLLSKSSYELYNRGVVPRNWPQFMVANLGRMDLPEPHETFRVRSIHGGSPVHGTGPFFFCSAVGMDNSLVIDVNYNTPSVPNEVAREFGQSLLEHLLVQGGSAAAPAGQP